MSRSAKECMTEKEATQVRQVLQSTGGYDNLRKGFPRFAEAVDALPDESKMCRVNVILREVFSDVVKRARKQLAKEAEDAKV